MLIVTDPGVKEALKKIFGAVTVGGLDKSNSNDMAIFTKKYPLLTNFVGLFKSKFPMQVFTNEYAVLYEFITNQRSVIFSRNSLKTVTEQSFDRILDSPYIDMSGFQFSLNGGTVTNEEKFIAYFENLNNLFDELSRIEVTQEEFDTACVIYMTWFKDAYFRETIQNMALIMQDAGFDYKKTKHRVDHLHGQEDAEMYYADRQAVLRSLDEESAIQHTVFDEQAYAKYAETDSNEDAILNYGLVEIDEVKGKMRRGNMVEVIGPPKGGKTTLTTFFVENALSSGLNVAIWPLEGTTDEWTSLISALMIRKDTSNGQLSVDKKEILNKDFSSEDQKEAANAALVQLASNKDRGRLSFIDGPCYVETMEDTLTYHYNNVNAFDVIVIDSPINVMSKNNRKTKTERISECYMMLKAYVSKKMKRKAICLCTAQIKQSVVDYIRSHPEEELDVTAGGESAETIRTPDEVIGVFSTKQEREMQRMKIYDVASRHNRNFRNSYVHCELGCGYFESRSELNE
jgi:hypothetical protein